MTYSKLDKVYHIAELSRYLLAGVANTVAGYIIFLVMLRGFDIGPVLSNATAYVAGLCVAYVLNVVFVFRHAVHSFWALMKYLLGFSLAYGVNVVVLKLALDVEIFIPEIAQLLAMGAYTLSFYIYNKAVVWTV